MRYLSVCSGIEAASCAWKSLGWKAVAYSEIEAFPCSVLKHHFPDTPNWGDMTKWRDWPRETIDLLVGGTPCQSFSTAGLRKGLDDVRGQLALGFSQIAKHSRPRWIVWENVPGVLSSGGGRDFGSFIGSLVELGYGLCWRVLDAQFFGVPQRRRRVFVVGYLGDWRNSAAVLFEQESLRGDSKAGRKKRKGTAKGSADSVEVECRSCGVMWEPDGPIECCPVCGSHQSYIPDKCGTLTDGAHMGGGLNGQDVYTGRIISTPKAFTAAEARRTGTVELKDQAPTPTSQTKRGDTEPCVLAFPGRMSATQRATAEDISPALGAKNPTAIAFHATRRDGGRILGDLSPTVEAQWGTGGGNVPAITRAMQVRRLTPLECERLQGFPDGWTDVPHRGKAAPDGPRYKAIGNSMAVPVMRWIGSRIQMVEELMNDRK